MDLSVEVVNGDIVEFKSDVLVLKYAQEFYGADAAVAFTLADNKLDLIKFQPKIDEFSFVDGNSKIGSNHVLFLGVTTLWYFGYRER